MGCAKPGLKKRQFRLLNFFNAFSVLILLFGLACGHSSHPSKEQEPPQQPGQPSPDSGIRSLLNLSFQVDPLAQTVSLQSSPGTDAGSIGAVSAWLTPTSVAYNGYYFSGSLVLIFVSLEGTDISSDLFSVKLQLTDLGSNSVSPVAVMPLITGFESAAGLNLVNGYNSQGLPDYDYGDFYSTARASIYKSGMLSRFSWVLVFDLSGLAQTANIQGQVTARSVPEDQTSQAEISIQPYLNNMTTNSVTVMWETDRESRSEIYFGPQPFFMNHKTGSTVRFQDIDYFNFFQPPLFNLILHKVELTGLEPGTTYYYQVRAAKTWGPVYYFQTLAAAPKPSFKFAVYGDTRTNDAEHASVVSQMANFSYDFQIHLGDFANSFDQADLRQNFFAIEQPLLSFRAMFPVRGNHEDFLWYPEYFTLPKSGQAELDNHNYSFSYQGAYFIIIDNADSMPIADGSAQFNWLANELAKAYADPNRKFTFLLNHVPLYTGYWHFAGPAQLSYLAPLFRTYDLSAGFAGHIHLYERLDVSGKPFIVSGSGGAPLFQPLTPPDPGMIAAESAASGETVSDQYYGWPYEFVLVEVRPDSFTATAIDNAGTVFDQVTYHK